VDSQPRAVVYLSTPGQLGRMPASVRRLRVVRDLQLALGSEFGAATLVVIENGIMRIVPSRASASRRRMKARTAHAWHGCPDLYFCLWENASWSGGWWPWYGPEYYGTGWWNYRNGFNNVADSMVNHRDGDTLLADLYDGDGTRYCARQQSEDSTFGNNPIGNNEVSSVALLGSSPDRC
jgi:hypothetical protein